MGGYRAVCLSACLSQSGIPVLRDGGKGQLCPESTAEMKDVVPVLRCLLSAHRANPIGLTSHAWAKISMWHGISLKLDPAGQQVRQM